MINETIFESLSIEKDVAPQEYKNKKNIKSIHIGRNVKEIGAEAFSMCENLETITVDKDNQFFMDGGCNAIIEKSTGILLVGTYKCVIPFCAKQIGPFAFCGQTRLESIIIPSNVKKIGANAFDGCENLTDIYIQEGLTTLEENCFKNCGKIKNICLPISLQETSRYIFGGVFEYVDDDMNITCVCKSPELKIENVYYNGALFEYNSKICLEDKFALVPEVGYTYTVHAIDGYWNNKGFSEDDLPF